MAEVRGVIAASILRGIDVEVAFAHVDEDRLELPALHRVGGRDEGVRRGDDLALEPRGVDHRFQRDHPVRHQRDVVDLEIVAQARFERLVERTVVAEDARVPDLLEHRHELGERRQIGARDVDGIGQGWQLSVFAALFRAR
jgi:hypothetical protein